MPSLPSSLFVKPILLALAFVASAAGLAAQVYKGAIVVNAANGDVLFEDRSAYAGPPASVTKLMTFLVVHDMIEAGELSLSTLVEVSAEDSRMGGTQVWLKHREVFPVEELLYALMVQSANDAAHALSHASGITREEFVARMNARARQIGMQDTLWQTPHGLPPRSRRLSETDRTSPRDLALLSLVLLRETNVLKYTQIERRPFGEGVRDKPVMMDNHNNLLGRVRGVDGLKTGFTRAAGFCLSATAERDGQRIVAVIMGAPTSQERDIKMAELIEDAFSRLPKGPFQSVPEHNPITALAPPPPEPAAAPAPAPSPAPEPATAFEFTPISFEDVPADASAADEEPPTVKFEMPE